MPRSVAASRLYPFILPLVLLLHATGSSAGPLLNEILYDPEGADEGLEFVELWNTDSIAVSLEGITLEAGDGSRPGSWTPIYTGAPGDSAPPGGVFLVPGGLLRAAIQNGPDAVRLTRAGEVLDLVGYGALVDPGLSEGPPAEDAPSGQSLARVRDGVDTGSNASDWAAEPEPTPGRPNHPDVRLALARGSVRLEPELAWPGEAVALSVAVRNRGRLGVDGAGWRLETSVRSRAAADTTWPDVPAAVSPGVSTSPEESVTVRGSFVAPQAGRFDLRLILRGIGGPVADTLFFLSRSAAGPLLLNEVAFHDRGAGEWVEVLVREEIPDLGAFALSDAGGRRYAVDRGALPRGAHAGDLRVLAEVPSSVSASYGIPDSLVLGCHGGWPALNDTDGPEGFADRVRLYDADGVLTDAVPYRAGIVERGGSLERLGAALPSASIGSWAECIDPRAGTPGEPNSMRAARAGEDSSGRLLLASERVLRRRTGAPVSPVILSFGAAARGSRVRVLVHDLLGRTRRVLVDGQRVLGEAALVWDGRDDGGSPVPSGAYVARAETIPDGGEAARSGSLALTVVDR